MPRAVFLDRDGVLVETLVRGDRALAPISLDEFRITAGARLLVTRLCERGLLPIVFSNQPDVGRGLIPHATLEEMHARLRRELPVVDIFVCVHDNGDACDCRKPRPGMLRSAADKWGIDLQGSFVVGDRWQDVDAGRAVGCYTILIERPYSGRASADARVATLVEAVDMILARCVE